MHLDGFLSIGLARRPGPTSSFFVARLRVLSCFNGSDRLHVENRPGA
jgi:hypothetical protein